MSVWLDRVETMKSLQRCVRCGKQDAYTMNGHQRCYECTEKGKEYCRKHNKELRENLKLKNKERYDNLKSQGICVICGKKKTFGNVVCSTCLGKRKI